MSQYKAVPRFTNKFPSDLLDAILGSSVKSINYAMLFFACVVFHILGTWSLPLIDRDEPRFAEASREMIERGNYIVPYFNNQLRLDKPPLTYWAQVRAITFSAKTISLLAFLRQSQRHSPPYQSSPGVAGWAGEKLGWWAAIIFTLSLQTFVHAKAAVADMWLVLFVTLANWAGYELFQRPDANTERATIIQNRKQSGRSPLVGGFFISRSRLGFLAKGPIAWTPLLTVAVVIIYTRDWQLSRRFKFIGGILLTLVAVALWGIPALIQTHGEFFTVGIGRHVISRSFTTMEGHGASSLGMYVLLLPFYFVTVFISFFPWSIKLPWLIRKLWRNRRPGSTPPATAEVDRYLSDLGHRDHLRHLYSRQHEVTALHAAGVSVACAFARAALAPRSGG